MTTKTGADASRHMKSAAIWGFAAFALWLGFIWLTARAGTLASVSTHDLMIAALGASFVAMAAGSITLMRRELADYANAARTPARRSRA